MRTKVIIVIAFVVTILFSAERVHAGETAPPNMALIPAGFFQMGDTFSEGLSSERPVHPVYLPAFYMDKYEVTKSFWDELKIWGESHGYVFANIPIGASQLPMRALSWYEALKWCNARSEREGRVPAYYTSAAQTTVYRSGNLDVQNSWVKWNAGYRLPTEAEWEKAARGGTEGHRFSWSDAETITHSRANYFSSTNYTYDVSPTRGYHPAFHYNLIPGTSPVGYFEPNGYGLYDMTGNVWEWCWDWWSGSYYSSSPSADPRGPSSGTNRILRGGGYQPYAFNCRVACRDYRAPSNGNGSLGFRSVLPAGSPDPIQTIAEVPVVQETYSSCGITRQDGKDSLVVITHGWIPKKSGDTTPPHPDWIDDMAARIRNQVGSNWQVETFEWKEKAWMTKAGVITDQVLENGAKEGGNLGKCVAGQGWNHIHLIGHSAGAAVVQAATSAIKDISSNISVHVTFLDPYVGSHYNGKSKYGSEANWAENYFAWDLDTFDGLFGKTASRLDHAYNVDVAQLDPNKVPLGRYRSTPAGVEECFEVVTSHDWPHDFYKNTIPPAAVEMDAQGFGFSLSKEGGGWDFALANYSEYASSTKVLGTPDAPCFLGHDLSTPTYPPWLMDFIQTPSVTSVSGIEKTENGLVLSSGEQLPQQSLRIATIVMTSEPVWIAVPVFLTNAANLVSFDAEFLGIGGEGVLSAYWETNVIGSIDERVALPGLQHYVYSLPESSTNRSYTLGFRLDSFSGTASSIVITNVSFEFVGTPGPFSLSVTGKDAEGSVLFELVGPSGFDYLVETSTNLIDWEAMAVLVNTNGAVPFLDRQSTSAARFYRAVGR